MKPRKPVDPQTALFIRGCERVKEFCIANKIPTPKMEAIPKDEWRVGACAYYRPQTIKICLEECARPTTDGQVRNWNWPGSTTDRTPYGVVCHELGHHVDWWVSEKKSSYGGEYSVNLRKESGEPEITSYCPNDWEWFAEIFRLYVTNQNLLKCIRLKTWRLLGERFTPVGDDNWLHGLDKGCPDRIMKALRNKGAR